MAKVIVGMVMSLDGYVADRDGGLDLLYADFAAMAESDAVQDAIRTTGAVVMGRRSYEMGNGDFTGYEFQVPIFVLTHDVPETVATGENDHLRFTFVTEGIASAIAQAKAAAGDRDVTVVGGASTIQQIIAAGLADEIHIDVRSILLGGGLRFFAAFSDDVTPIALESIGITSTPAVGVTHLRYRVRR